MSKKCVLNFMKSKWNSLELLWLGKCWIKIDDCHLKNESVKVLTKCLWKSLNNISLYENEIGDEGVNYLGCSNWLELKTINLSKYFVILDYTKVTGFGVMSLSKLQLKKL